MLVYTPTESAVEREFEILAGMRNGRVASGILRDAVKLLGRRGEPSFSAAVDALRAKVRAKGLSMCIRDVGWDLDELLRAMSEVGHTIRTVARVQAALSDDLLKPEYRGGTHPHAGHCYVASEALYHALGGAKAGWVPMNITHEGVRHWYLWHRRTGAFVDATEGQFSDPVPHADGRCRGFLTKAPSRRAQTLLERAGLARD